MQLQKHPVTHTTNPMVTGTSVLAMRTKKFVIIAADTLGSYGSMARYHNIHRIRKANDNCVLASGGEISDFQKVLEELEEQRTMNFCYDDQVTFNAQEVHTYLTRVCYYYRSRMNPYYNQFVVAGMIGKNKDEPYLGYCDLYGTNFSDNYVATGMGLYYGMPLLRKGWRADLTVDEARHIMSEAMRVLFYRDCKTINKIQFCIIDSTGINISRPVALETRWDLSEIHPVVKKPLYPAEEQGDEEKQVDLDA
jgi:20S proteasome subunit beta 7